MPPILVAGEALIDIVSDGTGREIPGGSPANVALGLSRLETNVGFATWIGDDDRGHRIAHLLEESKVRLTKGVFGARKTSTAAVRLTADGQPGYEFDIEWDLPYIDQVPIWLHVGSIGAFLEPGANKILDLVCTTAASGGTVSFDPNIRPALLPDSANARTRFEHLASMTEVLKLSDEDAQWLYPGFGIDQMIDRLLTLGVRLVVVTMGAAGSVLSTSLTRARVPGRSVAVVDTVGAGDTFMAALIWQLHQQASPLTSLSKDDLTRLGATSALAASITVGRRGADLPTLDDLRLVLSGA